MIKTVEEIRIEEYRYELPDDRIAKYPIENRDQSKLLSYRNGEISETVFSNLPKLLPSNSLMVFNNTRVIQARLHFYKETGARIEIFCLEPLSPNDYILSFQSNKACNWLCMIGNLKKWKEGPLALTLTLNGETIVVCAEKTATMGNAHEVRFSWDNEQVTFADILNGAGELPIPPYLNRATDEKDKETYQTVYSKIEGSVAAPTAGLHFTEKVFNELTQIGVKCQELTLHVGAGTFQPVKSETIKEHEMHTEFISVTKDLVSHLIDNELIIAVGTTSVRTLESLYFIGCTLQEHPNAHAEQLKVSQWQPYQREYTLTAKESLSEILAYFDRNHCDRLVTSTQIMIAPGYSFHLVKGIVTNFHQPSSTLLLLVSAFVDGDWKRIYNYALENDFRFLSYGDSSLLLR